MNLSMRVLVACAAWSLSACAAGSGRRPDTDSDGGSVAGRTDAGRGGGGTDAGTGGGGTDAGGGGTRPDAGTGGGGAACMGANDATMWAPLNAACLPRCSAATSLAVSDCFGDDLCVREALAADTTPGVPWTLDGTLRPEPMDCGNCFDYQYFSCAHLVCRAETNALQSTCSADSMGAACRAADMALTACLMVNDAGFGTCADMRIGACFAAGGGAGFLPGAAPSSTPSMDTWLRAEHRSRFAR